MEPIGEISVILNESLNPNIAHVNAHYSFNVNLIHYASHGIIYLALRKKEWDVHINSFVVKVELDSGVGVLDDDFSSVGCIQMSPFLLEVSGFQQGDSVLLFPMLPSQLALERVVLIPYHSNKTDLDPELAIQDGIVLHEGLFFLHSDTENPFFVLETSPFGQGIISQDTEIIFTTDNTEKIQSLPHFLTYQKFFGKEKFEQKKQTNHLSRLSNPLLLSGFISSLSNDEIFYDVNVLKKPLFGTHINLPFHERNLNLEIFCSINVLRSSMLFDSSWVLVKCNDVDRIGKIFLDKTIMDDKLHISPFMYHNLKLTASDKISISRIVDISDLAQSVNDAEIMTLCNDDQIPSDAAAKALASYFVIPRLLFVGDIIALPLPYKKYTSGKYVVYDRHVDFDSVTTILYFQVSSLGKDSFKCGFVSSEYTNLFQLPGKIHSVRPSLIEDYLGIESLPYPLPGFEEHTDTLLSLVKPCLHHLAASLGLTCTLLLEGAEGSGRKSLIKSLVRYLGINLKIINCYELLDSSVSKTENILKSTLFDCKYLTPCILLLDNINALEKSGTFQDFDEPPIAKTLQEVLSSLIDIHLETKYPVIVIGTVNSIPELSVTLRSCFRHEIKMEVPSLNQRGKIIEYYATTRNIHHDVSLEVLSTKTASFTPWDIQFLFALSAESVIDRLLYSERNFPEDIVAHLGSSIKLQDIEKSLEKIYKYHSAKLGAAKIPNVKWEDVGGLPEIYIMMFLLKCSRQRQPHLHLGIFNFCSPCLLNQSLTDYFTQRGISLKILLLTLALQSSYRISKKV
eukprot:TRINITY_DN3287_c0_g1_i1.p1 TRINITY_DN3287_c0_g1~~TRINITY_DN3287_c0_g1_i1.p1  ORF type:complete len:795 (-),score=137.36 TRINITY_DN3287_c0_g1_i1:102-2486(-)